MAKAIHLCGNATDAEDLVQEVILRFIEEFGNNPHLPAGPSGEAWLVKTLSHLFFDQCRRRRTRANGAQDPGLSEQAQEVAPPPAYDDITPEQLSEARDALSPTIRETYELHAAGTKYADIARLQGVPLGTVKKRLHSARAKLREYLQNFLQPGPR